MEYKDNFERFVVSFSQWRQPAKKQYNLGVLKHISMKMIEQAAQREGKVVIFGDKDPDGIFSSMIMKVYLERLMQVFRPKALARGDIGVDIRYSNREKDGFGLSKSTYDELSKSYALIITTDNGTSADFHSYSIGNLIVTDHHPLNEGEEVPEVPYIFNPNFNRKDGLEYSTSGGMVAYDIVRFIDMVLREQNAHYQTYLKNADNYYSHTLMFEVLKEYAAFTLISDMAKLDVNNRRFVLEAFSTIPFKVDKIPLYVLFEQEYTQNKLSFNIIPKINIDRMGQLHTINPKTGKSYMESFIRPKSMEEFTDAKQFIEKVDTERKAILSRLAQNAKTETINGVTVSFIEEKGVKVGLAGLIANKLAQKTHRPAIVSIPTSDKKKLSVSARGENIKELLSAVLPKGKAGGHSDACGGSLDIEEGETAPEKFKAFCAALAQSDYQAKPRKVEVVNNIAAPLAWSEAFEIAGLYKEHARGVEMSKPIKVAVYKPEMTSFFTYKSGEWGKVGFGTGKHREDMLINALEYPKDDIQKSEVIVFNLFANGTLSIDKLFGTIDEYERNTKQMPEAEKFGIASAKNNLELLQKPLISGADIYHRFAPDSVGSNLYYYQSFEMFTDFMLEDSLIVVPSYANDRNEYRNRGDVLEFFIGKSKDEPLDQAQMGEAYREFAVRLITASKAKEFIFIPDGLLDSPLISEQAKQLAKTIFAKAAVKHTDEKGVENEADQNIDAYQHANAS